MKRDIKSKKDNMNSYNKILVSILILAVLVTGCLSSEPDDAGTVQDTTGTPVDTGTKNRIATIETDKGIIKFELYEKRAPITTANFIKLAESGFYDGLIFHRVEPGFVIQGGDPLGSGIGGSDEKINLEIHPELKHTLGAVAMARKADPNSATSQFYITLAPQPSLDGNYAVFGQVIEGQDVVQEIVKGDTMLKVTIGDE